MPTTAVAEDPEAEAPVAEYGDETQAAIDAVRKLAKLPAEFPPIVVFSFLAGLIAGDAKASRAFTDQDESPSAWREVLKRAADSISTIRSRVVKDKPLDLLESAVSTRDVMSMTDEQHAQYMQRMMRKGK